MKPRPLVSILSALLVAFGTAHCADDTAGSYQRPKKWPKPTEPPPASPVYRESREPVPSEEEIERAAREHNAVLEREIEAGLESTDIARREAVIVFLLPELLQVEPGRVLDLLSRAEPGAKARALREEVARLWISQDPAAAMRWMKTLDETHRRDAAVVAYRELLPHEPTRARQLAREFELDPEQSLRERLSVLH